MSKSLKNYFKPAAKSPVLFVIFFIMAFILIMILVFSQKRIQEKPEPVNQLDQSQIQIQDKDRIIIIDKDGTVRFKSPTADFQQKWDQAKLESLLKNLKLELESLDNLQIDSTYQDNYSLTVISDQETQSFNIGKNNQEINSIFDNFDTLGGGGGGNNWFDNFFNPPGSNAPPPPGSSPSPSGSQAEQPSDCPLWLLSMCVYPPSWYASPSPSALVKISPQPSTSSPTPKGITIPIVPDCSLWNQLITGKTVVSNTLCVKEGQ